MAVKKIVLKVSINCQKCKKEVLKAVTKVEGFTLVAVDDEQGLLTVVGDVDPVCIVRQIEKINRKMTAEIISVGPPDNQGSTPPVVFVLPPCCNDCQLVAVPTLEVGAPSFELCLVNVVFGILLTSTTMSLFSMSGLLSLFSLLLVIILGFVHFISE